MSRPLLAVSLSLCLCPAATGQAVRALPQIATDAYGGISSFSIPPNAFRAQYWFGGFNLPAGTIVRDLGIRVARSVAVAAQSRQVGIVVASTPVGFGSLSPTFASNLGPTPVVFFTARNVSFPAVSATTDPNVAAAWFPGDQPFVFPGQDFVADFSVGASSATSVVPNDGWAIAPPSVSLHLRGRASCGGLHTSSYDAGSATLTWTVTGVPANAGVAFNVGLDNVEFAGLRLPLDLGFVGLTGCHLGVVPLTSGSATADGSGVATLVVPLPLPATSLAFASQGVHARVQNPQNPADFATTNTANTTIGARGSCNALFALGTAPTQSQQGPQPFSNAVVLLVR